MCKVTSGYNADLNFKNQDHWDRIGHKILHIIMAEALKIDDNADCLKTCCQGKTDTTIWGQSFTCDFVGKINEFDAGRVRWPMGFL
jgi:hypothetical protein